MSAILTSSEPIVDQTGAPVQLGAKLGTGGEGSVYAVADRELVAKLYHRTLSDEHSAKLVSMVSCCNDALRAIAAWPVALLHAGREERVCGFLMPRLEQYQPIHNIYGPAHRRAKLPNVDWAFLVHVARNLAAGFETIHAQGHVIGDVNQGNVFVANNATVKLIDCDSFQVGTEHRTFFCDVGVPHFTAPELQRLRSFHGLRRTVHHDNFGLAVLIFHLLFMGRHPFAGVYAGHEDMPIERAIRDFRYAFAAKAQQRRMARPPGSIGPEVVTAELAALFEQAFRKGLKPLQRPPARRWLEALEALQHEIRTCSIEPLHRYCGALAGCPWCELEGGGQVFFVPSVTLPIEPASFDLEAAWRRIQAVQMPQFGLPVSPTQMDVRPVPVPLGVSWAMLLRVLVIGAILLLILSTGMIQIAILIGMVLVSSGWLEENPMTEESRRRAADLADAQRRWHEIEQQWPEVTGEVAWQRKRAELAAAREEYGPLEAHYLRAKQELGPVVRQRQLRQFLSQFHIDDAAIPLIGPTHKATLTSFGIETAADLEPARLARLPGFSTQALNVLLAWQREHESRFRFDPTRSDDLPDLQVLTRRFAQRRRKLITDLQTGAEALQSIGARHEPERGAFVPVAEAAARALAQARADMTAV